MDSEFPYFVIELDKCSRPPPSYLPFLAVPSSWINHEMSSDSTVLLYLPNEGFQTMERLAKSGENPGENWDIHFGKMHMGNENIEDAWNYIVHKNSEWESQHVQTDDSDLDYEDLKPKRRNYKNGRDYNAKEKKKEAERKLRFNKRLAEKQAENHNKISKVKTIEPDNISAIPSTSSSVMTEKHSKQTENNEKIKLLKNLSKVLKYQHKEMSKLYITLNTLPLIVSGMSNSIVKAMSEIRRHLDNLDDDENGDEDGDEDVTPKPIPISIFQNSKKPKTGSVYEYPENTDKSKKWTLKYPFQCRSDLVELMPESGIYVSERGLKTCNEKSNNSSELARSLIYEVFSDAALQKCQDDDNQLLEDVLDYYALVVLEMYVSEFCLKHNYPIFG